MYIYLQRRFDSSFKYINTFVQSPGSHSPSSSSRVRRLRLLTAFRFLKATGPLPSLDRFPNVKALKGRAKSSPTSAFTSSSSFFGFSSSGGSAFATLQSAKSSQCKDNKSLRDVLQCLYTAYSGYQDHFGEWDFSSQIEKHVLITEEVIA